MSTTASENILSFIKEENVLNEEYEENYNTKDKLIET